MIWLVVWEFLQAQVGSTIRTALFGKEVSKFKDGEDEYPITMRLADKYRYDVSSLMNQRITFRSQSNGRIMQIPVSSVADYTYNNTTVRSTEKI